MRGMAHAERWRAVVLRGGAHHDVGLLLLLLRRRVVVHDGSRDSGGCGPLLGRVVS